MTDEEFAKLAELSAKALNPAVAEAQNATQNQTESNTAIEGIAVESEAANA